MKYTVLKFFTKRSEGFKPYEIGSTIELSKEEAKTLLDANFIKAKKNESKGKKGVSPSS